MLEPGWAQELLRGVDGGGGASLGYQRGPVRAHLERQGATLCWSFFLYLCVSMCVCVYKNTFKKCKEGPHVVQERSRPSPLHGNPMPTGATLPHSFFTSKEEAEDSECLPSMHGALGL